MSEISLEHPFEQNKQDFILIEIETGFTFATVAADSHDRETSARNLRNARKAYDTARHFLAKHDVHPAAKHEAETKLAKLKHTLMQLGETFQE